MRYTGVLLCVARSHFFLQNRQQNPVTEIKPGLLALYDAGMDIATDNRTSLLFPREERFAI
jgi:hypothetical protein